MTAVCNISRLAAPYRLPDGPVVIQFSGGRTSAYMLHEILDTHDGALPADCFVLFQNTGREMPETLAFVEECGRRWGVEIHWLEFDDDDQFGFRRVGPGTNRPASVNGEPFEALIRRRRYLPNQHQKFCTAELKVRPSVRYMHRWLGYERWQAAVGIRADETHRCRQDKEGRHTVFWPLVEAGVGRHAVMAFWAGQPFDLRLPAQRGRTPLGNCDGCFLKSERNRAHLARYFPERAAWWARMEAEVSAVARGQAGFFDRRVRWETLIEHAARQADWVFDLDDAESLYCVEGFGGCHD